MGANIAVGDVISIRKSGAARIATLTVVARDDVNDTIRLVDEGNEVWFITNLTAETRRIAEVSDEVTEILSKKLGIKKEE